MRSSNVNKGGYSKGPSKSPAKPVRGYLNPTGGNKPKPMNTFKPKPRPMNKPR